MNDPMTPNTPADVASLPAKLLPCPFCGGKPSGMCPPTCNNRTPYNPADRAFPIVRCACGVEVWGKDWDATGESAVKKWNRRALTPAGEGWGPSYKQPWQAKEDAAQSEARGVDGETHAILQWIVREAEAAKEPCGSDPESSAAIRNGRLASIAQAAAQALGIVRGPSYAAPEPVRVDDVRAKYDELLYAVGNKYPGESRHETALRYIRAAETYMPNAAVAALANQEPPDDH